ncbi:MAG: CDP-diacylglycerol--serine O-phosphatidyltransferase [Candidatus Cryptobacteroides sp.]
MSLTRHIPNAITSINLLCGVIGVIVALNGNLQTAFLLMLASAAADFLDGLAARLLKAYSEIGKELDSLADDVSFGVLPAVMLSCACVSDSVVLKYFPLLIAVFSALRLAKFNIDERQHSGFIGLPTPACAMLCGSLASLAAADPAGAAAAFCRIPFAVPVLSALLCWLLVCEVPMFAFKVATGEKASRAVRTERIIFLVLVLASVPVTVLCGAGWQLIPLISFAGYILINLAGAAFCRPH